MATALIASFPQPTVRYCVRCLAIYRQEFLRCPLDGAALVVGANDPWIGLTVGHRYVIEALIGEGAMGRVYRAHHHQFRDRRYAIKILLGDLAATAQMRARFELEAAHAAKLSHPNVVGVLDFGTTAQGINFMVMELVEGATLGALLSGDPMDPERVILLARQICEGLDHAHERGVIHRDLKPENIIVLRERDHEIARIVDFGLALSKDDVARLTTTGVVCTPAYASPEQLRGDTMDHRVDLYALGTSMYEMLSGGTLPFNGDVDATVTNKLANDPPSILLVAPHVPPALVSIVGRLLSRHPDRRPRSARAVIRALDQALAAPRIALTEETQRLRARAVPDLTALARDDAQAYTALETEMPTRANRVRRTAVQLLACGLTLSGVLAWVDMHGSSVRAEPALVAVAEPASTTAASLVATTLLETNALHRAVDGVAAQVVVDVAAVDIVTETPLPASSYPVPSFSVAYSGAVRVPTQLQLAVEQSTGNPAASLLDLAAKPVVEPSKRARPQRRPAARRPRVIRADAEPVPEPMPEMGEPANDVVEEILRTGTVPPTESGPVAVPGVTATPAVVTPPSEPASEPANELPDEVVFP